MKTKVTIVIVSVLLGIFSANSAFAGVAIKLGLDWKGDYDFSNFVLDYFSESKDVEMGYSVSGEFFGSINEYFDLGVGLTWQLPRSQKGSDGKFILYLFTGWPG